jgi:Spy/CpxP family protein refolding chaperone
MQRSKSLALAFLLVAFIAGGTLGFAMERVGGSSLFGRRGGENKMLDRFAAELSLTPAQRTAVDSILDERHRLMEAQYATIRPQMNAIRDSARNQIALRLTPEQRVKYDQYLAAQRQKAEQRRADK